MRAEDTLQFMMDFQGYHNRQECLNHLFCEIGCGYEWVDGELVEDSHNTEILLSRWQLINPIDHAEPPDLVLKIGRIYEEFFTRAMIPEPPKWSTLCKEYSYLYNYPEDIKPDWKALLEECKQMLIDDGIEVEY